MAEFARGPDRAALQGAARDDAGAQAGGHLEQQQVVEGAQITVPFGQRHHVGVVVDEHRGRGQVAEVGPQRHAVPPGQGG